MATLSVIISAFNEEKKLPACLASVKEIADEIIVVDNSSTDDTAKIAKKMGATVYERKNNPMLNINKNFGFSKAKSDWILNLDADERVTPELAQEIRSVINDESHKTDGYFIPRKNIIFGKWIQNAIWWPDYQLRLFRKNKGKFAEKHVHELLEVEGQTEHVTQPLLHENYETVSQYLYKLDKIYTENEAEHFIQSGKKIAWFDAIRFPVKDFLSTFFAKKGYKDGLHGLVLSILQAFYAEIVFAKIWEKQGFPEYNSKNFVQDFYQESRKLGKEVSYWFLTSFIDETKNKFKKIHLRIKRKRYQ